MARRAAPAAMPLPADVRWMNAVAAVLLTAVALAAGVGVVAWMVRQPMWTLRGITLVGDVAHQNAVTVRALVVPHLRGTFLCVREAYRSFKERGVAGRIITIGSPTG